MPESPQSITRGPWFRGVDYSRPADELDDNTLYACGNTSMGNGGQAEKRLGCAVINATALNSAATVLACGRHRFSSSSVKEFAIVGNKFYENIDAATPDDRTNSKTITAGDDNIYSLVNAGGTLIGHNGVAGDDIIKWAASGNIATLDVDSRFTAAEFWEWWDRRAWAANTNVAADGLNYSDAGDIETWGANALFNFGFDMTGIRRWSNGIVCHMEEALALLQPTGIADTPYRKNDIILGEDNGGIGGSVSGYAIVNVPYVGQCFPRRDGIYAFTGGEVIKISGHLDGSRYWDSINADRLSESFAQIYPLRNEVWFWLPYGSVTNMNHVMVLNYRLTNMVGEPVWYGPYVDLTRNCAGLIDDLPAFGGFDGFIYKHNTTMADVAAAIDGWFETGSRAPEGGMIDCQWQRNRVFYEVKGTYEIEVQDQSVDAAAGTSTVEMGGSYDSIETSFTIGVSKIAGDDIVEYADLDMNNPSSPFKLLRFRNANANEPFSIRRSSMSYKDLGALRRDKSGAH